MDHPAWCELSLLAKAIFIGIARRHNGSNNGRIGYGDADVKAQRLAFNNVTIRRGFQELCHLGFTELRAFAAHSIQHDGDRRVAEWRITCFKCDGQPATDDFKRWKPGAEVFALTARIKTPYRRLARPAKSGPEKPRISYPALEMNGSSPHLSVDASLTDGKTIYSTMGGAPLRGGLSECEHARKLARTWLADFGRGGNRQLAQHSGMAESRLSKFLSPEGKGRTLPQADLARLLAIVDPQPAEMNGRAAIDRANDERDRDLALRIDAIVAAQSGQAITPETKGNPS